VIIRFLSINPLVSNNLMESPENPKTIDINKTLNRGLINPL